MPLPKRLLSWLPIAICLAVTWFAVAYRLPGPRIVVSPATTYLTEPLHEDGLPDYARYLLERERKGVTKENNGAIPFLRAVWPAGLDEEECKLVCNELGMDVPAGPGMKSPSLDKQLIATLAEWLLSIDPERAERVRRQEERAGAAEGEAEGLVDELGAELADEYKPQHEADEFMLWAFDHPWRREQIPPLAEWIDRHAPQYDLLHEGAARERFYCPSTELLSTPHLTMGTSITMSVEIRTVVGEQLAMRGRLFLGEGDVAAAWRDCRAMFRLAAHVPHELMLSELISIHTEVAAHELVHQLLSSPDLDVATAREMLDFLRQLPPRDSMARLIDVNERFASLSYFIGESGQGSELRREEGDQESRRTRRMMRSLDWNAILRQVNERHDEIAQQIAQGKHQVGQDEPPAVLFDIGDEEKVSFGEAVRFYVSRSERTRRLGNRLVDALLPAWRTALAAQDRANAQRQLLVLATALTIYHLEQGEYPENLTDLVPNFLPELAADPYGSPLVYRRTGEGFIVYSRGPNGKDDEGSSGAERTLEGIEVDLYDLEVTLENENHLRQLLGRPELTAAEFAQLNKPADDEPREENQMPEMKRLTEEIPETADDHSLRLPLPRLKLPLPSSPPKQE